jgi:hypothetical protein
MTDSWLGSYDVMLMKTTMAHALGAERCSEIVLCLLRFDGEVGKRWSQIRCKIHLLTFVANVNYNRSWIDFAHNMNRLPLLQPQHQWLKPTRQVTTAQAINGLDRRI